MASERALLLVGNFLSASHGVRSVCEELADRLQGAGWSLLTTSRRPARLERLADMVSTTWRRRRDYRVAHVEVYSGPAFFWAEMVCWTLRRARKPYALTLHGGNLPRFALRSPGRVRRLLRSAAVVTTPSGFLQEAMRSYRDDLEILPNALDLSRYPFRLRSRPEARLVWLRSFHEIYNPSLAPRIVAELAGEFPDLRLTMVGPDKGDGSLGRAHRAAQEHGVADRITWPGGVPKADVPRWLDGGDLFLNTTNVDNTPVSVLEAMACGLPVASTNVGGIPYLIEPEREGLLFPPDAAADASAAIRRILTEPGLAETLSRGARARAESCDWSTILPRWESLLRGLEERAP